MWAAENSGQSKMSKQKAGSTMRYALWEFGRENTKELVVQLVPKAMAILDKHFSGQDEEGVVREEERSIKEMEKLLAAAIKESQEA